MYDPKQLITVTGTIREFQWTNPHVIVEFNPLRSGEHGGSFKKATLVESGKVLEVKLGPPAATPEAKQP